MLDGWVPSDFISMAEQVSWPICAVIIGFLIRPTLFAGFLSALDFLKGLRKINIKGLSFESGVQIVQAIAPSAVDEPKNLSVFKEHLGKRSSDYSEDLKDIISQNYSMYSLAAKDEIELLKRELSITIVERMYLAVLNSIYLSQINLIKLKLSDDGKCSYTDMNDYFELLKVRHKVFYANSNLHGYVGYLTNMSLIESDGSSYSLTKYGKGFLKYIDNNPHSMGNVKSV